MNNEQQMARNATPPAMDKQTKKRLLQECLKDIKRLVAARYNVDTVGSVDALQRVLAQLKRPQPPLSPGNKDERSSSPLRGSFDELGTDFACAKCVRAQHMLYVKTDEQARVVGVPISEDDASSSTSSMRHTSPNLLLSLPKEDASFVEFLQAPDRENFRTALTRVSTGKRKSVTLFVQSRSVEQTAATHPPMRLTLRMHKKQSKDANNNPGVESNKQQNAAISQEPNIVSVKVQQLFSVYAEQKAPDQELRFMTRHDCSGRILTLSDGAVPALGFLPQAVTNRSLFDFVHRDDAAALFTALLSARLTHTRGHRWRCVCSHGHFVRIQSEWYSWANPWTHQVEIVLGMHRIVEPPATSNIFDSTSPPEGVLLTSEEKVTITEKLTEALTHYIQTNIPSFGYNTNIAHTHNLSHNANSVLHARQHAHNNARSNQQHTNNANIGSAYLQALLLSTQGTSNVDASEEPLSLVVDKKPNNGQNNVHLGAYVDSLVEAMAAAAGQPSASLLGHDNSSLSTLKDRLPMLLGAANDLTRQTGMAHSVSLPLLHQSLSMPHSCVPNSSPESTASSGPALSYTQINCLENVQRLLASRPPRHPNEVDAGHENGQHSDQREGNVTSPERQISSPEEAHTKPIPVDNMHRSHSAIEPLPLTRETLQRHTKNWEREYKLSWKRRMSARTQDTTPTALNQPSNIVQAIQAIDEPPAAKVYRPSSMPTTHPLRQNNPVAVTSAATVVQRSVNQPAPRLTTALRMPITMASASAAPAVQQNTTPLRPTAVRAAAISQPMMHSVLIGVPPPTTQQQQIVVPQLTAQQHAILMQNLRATLPPPGQQLPAQQQLWLTNNHPHIEIAPAPAAEVPLQQPPDSSSHAQIKDALMLLQET